MNLINDNQKRDGKSQKQRYLPQLFPENILIDDHSTEYWINFFMQISKSINYYNQNNQIEKNWTFLFPKEDQINTLIKQINKKDGDILPALSLFIVFINLLSTVQKEFNGITKKHLEFFYQNVLGFSRNLPEGDKIQAIFEINKNGPDQVLIKKDTILFGSKDPESVSRIYKTDRDFVVGRAQIASLKTIFIDEEFHHRVYSASVANSQDGKGLAFTNNANEWSTFGESQLAKLPIERTMEDAKIGFVISSPIFWLQEGKRVIEITMYLKMLRVTSAHIDFLRSQILVPGDVLDALDILTNISFENLENLNLGVSDVVNQLSGYSDIEKNDFIQKIYTEVTNRPLRHIERDEFQNMFEVFGSGAEGWIPLFINSIGKVPEENAIAISLNLPANQPSIVANGNPGLKFDAKNPLIYFQLVSLQGYYGYFDLKDLLIDRIDAKVTVNGFKTLLLENEFGTIDSTKPFLPFGPQPYSGSTFYLGSQEIFSKHPLDSLTLNWQWADLPGDEEGFKDYYSAYEKNPNAPVYASNYVFKGEISLLIEGNWIKPPSSVISLFEDQPLAGNHLQKNIFDISLLSASNNVFTGEQDFETSTEFAVDKAKNGFIKIVLQSPDFGHRLFPIIYASKSFENSKAIANNLNLVNLPNPPYTPKLNFISLDYTAKTSIDTSSIGNSTAFFHVEPFGSKKISQNEVFRLLPQYSRGNLFLGISGLTPPTQLSILFNQLEGSSDPEIAIEPTDVKWSYLSQDSWVEISRQNITLDSTQGLIKSGIIELNISREATNAFNLLPSNLYWVRATIDKDPSGINKTTDILTQGVTATLQNPNDLRLNLSNSLAPGTITKIDSTVQGIKTVQQPFPSFGGKAGESDQDFYLRVSERLRHRQRGVTQWDFESLVLNKFPEIYKVKLLHCINEDNEIEPGTAKLIIIPKNRSQHFANKLAPKANQALRESVRSYISNFISPFTKIYLDNPKYENLQVEMKVGLKPGFDGAYYARKLNEEIVKFLAPWAFEEGQDIVIGGRIHKTSILKFVETREYVDYVTNFKLLHFNKGPGLNEMRLEIDFIIREEDYEEVIDYAEASSPRSVLVSAQHHNITILDGTEESCSTTLINSGLEFMRIEVDFIIF